MKKELKQIETMSLANSCVENLLEHIISRVAQLKTEYPDYESDDFLLKLLSKE